MEQFAKLQKLDPYQLENMDTYSDLLYLKGCILLLLNSSTLFELEMINFICF